MERPLKRLNIRKRERKTMPSKITCESEDICKAYEDGRCRIGEHSCVTVVSCSKRELTAMGKALVTKGERK